MPLISRVLLLSLMLLVSACTTRPAGYSAPDFSTADLLSGVSFGPEAAVPATAVDLLGVDDEMRDFLHRHVPQDASDRRKTELILAAIIGSGLQLDYNNTKTYTASEAFQAGEGNCLSFTNLFIALAREAGIRTWYQEVQVPRTWTTRDDTYVYNLHINALVKDQAGERVVDFDMGAFDEQYHRRRLRDDDALSQYHNNMGVHWMGRGDSVQAFRHFREALALRPRSAYLWTNLGALYRRAGDDARAEAALQRAVALDRDLAAMNNLESLYRQQGREELADFYRSRVHRYRLDNPYYLFHLAEEAYAVHDFTQTEALLRKALRKLEGDEHRFHGLLGLVYTQQGKLQAADEQFRLAASLAVDDAMGERYNRKLKLLAARP